MCTCKTGYIREYCHVHVQSASLDNDVYTHMNVRTYVHAQAVLHCCLLSYHAVLIPSH